MGMEDWDFLGEHIKLQKEFKAQSSQKKESKDDGAKVKPDGVFVQDIVGGRPVFGHPMRSGGFRLRYGRGRASGYSGQSIHPATMSVLEGYLATGTQLKVERPGKAASFTPCTTIMGPVVKLKDGSVVAVTTQDIGDDITKNIKEILYLGDALINYGDFFDRAHILVPPGYVEEYWTLELKELLEKGARTGVDQTIIDSLLARPNDAPLDYLTAKTISENTIISLHPQHIFFYKEITPKQLLALISWAKEGDYQLEVPKLKLPINPNYEEGKRALEILGVPHEVKNNFAYIRGDVALALCETLQLRSQLDAESVRKRLKQLLEQHEDKDDTLYFVNQLANVHIRDKSGIFIGSRMGRPEKAKMRKLTGSPNSLFPVGEDGGRLRSFQSALQKKKITSTFPVFKCTNCANLTPLTICEMCETETERQKIDRETKEAVTPAYAKEHEDRQYLDYKEWSVPINSIFEYCLRKLGTKIYPDLIKGVRGTVSKDRTPEHPIKGILRATYGVAVNKDGTVRYDASEITLTHFKPKEIGTSVTQLKELGYTHDVYGKELENEEQVLELRAQDVVLPACPDALDPGSDDILLRTSKFIDELLVKLYNTTPYYNAKTAQDLVGHLIIGLAPHTSAGTIGRIIGFSKTQGFFAHPMYHAAMRRDCDGDESCFFLVLDAFLNFSTKYLGTSRGSTMDAPLVLTSLLNPAEVDDMAFNMDIVDHYPLEFYRACEEYKYPWDVKIKKINEVLFTPQQFEGMMFTHDTADINAGVLCSAYKTLPSMGEKIEGQMSLAKKIRATDTSDVARLIIDKHFIRDTKGNLRKFSLQKFRCVSCNEKYRRPPLVGKCTECGGKIIFTISEGSIIKYMQMSIDLAEEYAVSDYLKESLYLTQRRILDMFGKDKEKQLGLGEFG
jgi:DNA polymerase II large subunit